ncbi:MAG: metal ABC transporter permease [Christensenellales bacterium]
MEGILAIFADYTFQTVALGSALLGLISGVVGSFAVLRRQSLLGDGISHAALPGVVMAFIVTGSRNAEVLLLGGLISGLMASFIIISIVRNSHIRFDSALALVMSVFFGLGLVLLTWVQKMPNANQAGLSRFVFGQASTLLQKDVLLMAATGIVLISLTAIFWKELKLFSFDSGFLQSLGFSNARMSAMLSFMVVMTVIIGIQTVGVILMSAMLVAPAVAARQWTDKLSVMVSLSAAFGAVSGVAGTTASSLIEKLPTGPAIVVFVSGIVALSVLFAPGRGVVYKAIRQAKKRSQINGGGGGADVGGV